MFKQFSSIRQPIVASRLSLCCLLAGGLVALGCSPGPELEPAKSANATALGTAHTQTAGVQIQANGERWSGDSEVRKYVTPVQIAIDNGGSEPLRVRYSYISLTDANGNVFRALPPFDVNGSVQKRVDRLVPRFGFRGAAVAPYLGNVYQGLEVEPPPSYMDYAYYDELYDNWRVTIPLPTQYMQEVALPEALIRPRGELSGYVYFEHVPESSEHVTLNVHLVNADTGEALGVAQIPFDVD